MQDGKQQKDVAGMRFVSRSTTGISTAETGIANSLPAARRMSIARGLVCLAAASAILCQPLFGDDKSKGSGIVRYVEPPVGKELQLNSAEGASSPKKSLQSSEKPPETASIKSPSVANAPRSSNRNKKGPATAHLDSGPSSAKKVIRISGELSDRDAKSGSRPVSFEGPVRMQLNDTPANENAAAEAARRIRNRLPRKPSRPATSFSPPPIQGVLSDQPNMGAGRAKPVSFAASNKRGVIFESNIDFSRLAAPKPSAIVYAQPPRDVESLEQIKGQKTGGPIDELDEGFKPITSIGASIRPEVGELPTDFAATRFARVGQLRQTMGASRQWGNYAMNWEAPGLCHRPLQFEEVNLERYGYSAGFLQPAISAAHFFGTVPLLPYKMTVDKPWSCNYTLGHYRPGSYAPFRPHRLPLRFDATSVQGWVATGLIFWIP